MSEQKFDISGDDLDTLMNGSLLKGVQVFRRVTGWDLVMSKRAVENFRAKVQDYRDFFDPQDKCPHCKGSGFKKSTGNT